MSSRTIQLQSNYHKKGFTLIELLVVVAIIGTLASIIFANLNSSRSKARDTQKATQIEEIKKALALYHLEHNNFPPDASGTSIPLNSLELYLVPDYISSIPSYLVNENDYFSSGSFGYAIRLYLENSGLFGSDIYGQCKTGETMNPLWWPSTPVCEL